MFKRKLLKVTGLKMPSLLHSGDVYLSLLTTLGEGQESHAQTPLQISSPVSETSGLYVAKLILK